MNEDVQVSYARAQEALRQERLTFELARTHANKWFHLRLAMGIASIVMLPAIMVVSSTILLSPASYSGGVLSAAAAALFVDALGLLVSVWKIVLNKESQSPLAPVTTMPELVATAKAEAGK